MVGMGGRRQDCGSAIASFARFAVATLLLWSCSRTALDFSITPASSSGATSGAGGSDGGNSVSAGSTSSSTTGTGGTSGGGASTGGAGGDTPICDWAGPPALWNRRFGNDSAQRGEQVAADSEGNVILFGRYSGDIDLGGGWSGIEIYAGTQQAIFLAKYTPEGDYAWSRVIGAKSTTIWPYSLAVGPSGRSVIAGHFDNTIDLGTGPMNAVDSEDAFVAGLDANGKTLWAKAWGGLDRDMPSATVTAAGYTVVGINAQSTLDLGGGPLPAAGDYDILVVKLDTAGKHVWSKRFGDAATQGLSGIVAVPGGVVLAGIFYGTLDFGNAPLVADEWDLFVAKLDDGGNLVWARRFPASGVGFAYLRLAADLGGNVLLGGDLTNAEVNFGGGLLTGQGHATTFMAKLNSAGDHLWSKMFPTDSGTYTYSIAADRDDNVLFTGGFEKQIDFGGGPLNVGEQDYCDLFVAKLAPDGQHMWSRRAGGPIPGLCEQGLGIASDSSNNVLLTGEFSTSICFGLGTQTSAGDFDAFLVKLPP